MKFMRINCSAVGQPGCLANGGGSGTLKRMSREKPPNLEPPLPGTGSDVPLAPLTSLELGGAARYFVEAGDTATATDAIRWARSRDLPLAIIAGGSNVVVADSGWPGMVLRVATRGVALEREGDVVRVTAAAGEPWDELVERCVGEDLAGVECLSGIPGSVGATPIQNVGAYGQEASEVIENIQILDLLNLGVRSLSGAECGFGYRTSRIREIPGRFLVLAVTFRLWRGGVPTVRYAELERALGARRGAPRVADVREAVLDLRRVKSMVIDEADPNRRSVGSFFVNPVLDDVSLAVLEEGARDSGALLQGERLPSFPMGDGRSKVSAAWLIEHAGFEKGLRRGSVGISDAHALALVHHGGGTTAELVALARNIREGVLQRFSIELQPEPVFLGFPTRNPLSDG
jgi:UDP-N-acetylmuramate dehydrogenase